MRILKFLINRAALTSFLLIIELALIILSVVYISEYFWYLYLALQIISIFVVLHVVNNDQDPTTKLPWLAIVLIIPPIGAIIYVLFNSNLPRRRQLKVIKKINLQINKDLKSSSEILEKIEKTDKSAFRQATYIENLSKTPLYQNTKTIYFKSGEKFFEKLKEELSKAEHFIFMEYFIIDRGELWNEIYEILKQKASENVEIKILYDDIGSIYKLPYNFNKKISGKNIQCIKFNKYRPFISAVHNNRDHRKMTIIDNKVAFTGGVNIADEYANQKKLYGYWKDAGIMLHGEAVQSMTLEFLKTFYTQLGHTEDIGKYFFAQRKFKFSEDGFVQPFFDGPYPIYKDRIGENVYINLINQAEDYIYITTPYLIIDYNFMSALKLAAKRGVDVRLITPYIPDKKIIFLQTRASYKQLLKDGVKIYEYTPGFMHAKTLVCDDKYGIVGTFNIDYRSFVHHFENGVWLYKTKSISKIKDDFQKTQRKCKQIKIGNYHFGPFKKFFSDIISIFSALM